MADTAVKPMIGETVDSGCTKQMETTTVEYLKETVSAADSLNVLSNNNHDNRTTFEQEELPPELPSASFSSESANDRNHQQQNIVNSDSDFNALPDQIVTPVVEPSTVSEDSGICNNELIQEVQNSNYAIPSACLSSDVDEMKNSNVTMVTQNAESNIASSNIERESNEQVPSTCSMTPLSELDGQSQRNKQNNTVPEHLHEEPLNATPVLPQIETPSDIQTQHSKEPAETQPVLLSESINKPLKDIGLSLETEQSSLKDSPNGVSPDTEQSKGLNESKDTDSPSEGTSSTQMECSTEQSKNIIDASSSENATKPLAKETGNAIDLSVKGPVETKADSELSQVIAKPEEESVETKADSELSQVIAKPETDKVIDCSIIKSKEVESVDNHVTLEQEKVVMDPPSKEIPSMSTIPESVKQSSTSPATDTADMGHPNAQEEQPIAMKAEIPASSDETKDILEEMEVNDIPQTSSSTNSSIKCSSRLRVKVTKLNFTESQIAHVGSRNTQATTCTESDKDSASGSEVEEPPTKKAKSDEEVDNDLKSLENLSAGKYVFKLSEREKSNKLFHLQFNCASNKYVRVSDYNWEINGWETAVFTQNNMVRKEEQEWQMVYLSRQEGKQSASIEWRFDFRNDTSLSVDRVRLKATSKTKYSGNVTWSVRCCFPGSSDDVIVPFPIKAGEQTVPLPKLKGCHMIGLCAQLSGGQGNTNWQHAQLFRTGLRDYVGCQFEIMVHLKGELWQIEKVLHGKYIKGKLHYLVKWKGYSQKDNTWEPEEHLNAMTRKHLAEHPVRITGKAPGKRKSGTRK